MAVIVTETPRLIPINRGGCIIINATVNGLSVADVLQRPPWLIAINRGGHFTMPAAVNLLTAAVLWAAGLLGWP